MGAFLAETSPPDDAAPSGEVVLSRLALTGRTEPVDVHDYG
jgi:hypothetical protein